MLVRQHGGMGRLTLNRPEQLNAPSQEMVATMRHWLDRWRTDAGVRVVVIDGAGERGLSAGDDVRELYEDARRGARRTFDSWVGAYRLAAEIARHPKPVVSLMDAVVMGSGMGLGAHASHRVVDDDSLIAMPEVAIAAFPGVGATYLFARAPGEVGTHLALTGDRMDAADAIYCGIADWWVPMDRRSTLLAALANADAHGDVDDALHRLSIPPPWESELRGQRSWIDACYASNRVEDVVRLLSASESREARAAAGRIAGLAPTALKVVLRALREARADARLEDALRREFGAATRLLLGNDVLEGIRALALDRDHAAVWVPNTLESVTDADVDAYFAPMRGSELDLEQPPRAP